MAEVNEFLNGLLTEQGNTLITRENGQGLFFAALEGNGQTYLTVAYQPENYPSFLIQSGLSKDQVLKQIHECHCGWIVQKSNIDEIYVDEDGAVDTPPKFQAGQLVYWTDPDDDATSRFIRITSYITDGVYNATNPDGSGYIEVMESELSIEK